MFQGNILCVQRSEAVRHAAKYLSDMGLHVTSKAAPDVSHVLLPIPSFSAGDGFLAHILADLPEDVIISGGNLDSMLLDTYRTVDYLKDPYYLAENAAITAECARRLAELHFGRSLQGHEVLVVGWGRIGKCLCRLLEKAGAAVTVAARKDGDRAMVHALGQRGISISNAADELTRYHAVFNTVPAMVLPEVVIRQDAVVLELASKPGISGDKIIDARGLPSKMAPAESGKLIAKTFIRLSLGKEDH